MKILPVGPQFFNPVTRTEMRKLLVPILQCCESAW